MTLNMFSSGVNPSFTSQLNNNFKSDKTQQIYTGAGLNLSVGASATSTSSYEFTALASSTVALADYVTVDLSFDLSWNNSSTSSGNAFYVQIQTKQIGGAYGDSLAEHLMWKTYKTATTTQWMYGTVEKNIHWRHTLSAGEKSNGVQVKVLTKITNEANSSATLANVQAVLRTDN